MIKLIHKLYFDNIKTKKPNSKIKNPLIFVIYKFLLNKTIFRAKI